MDKRESLSSRLGFILLSAGCAIGIGNVYKFPIMTGTYGGGFFVLFYLLFLVIMGLPIMTMELGVGRASKKSIALSFEALEKPKQKWHIWKYFAIAGSYLLMMCYTTIVAWIAIYFINYLNGNILQYETTEALEGFFGNMVANPTIQIITVFAIVIICFGICALGLKNGVENVSKVLMILLFVIILGIGIYSLTLSGAGEGLAFYLLPSTERLMEAGIIKTMSAAMNQAFFTLSLGIGCILVFGSYIEKKKTLVNESIAIISLDTLVALLSGLIIFPACFTYAGKVEADGSVGAGFIFTTFSNVCNHIPGAQIIGALFFLLLLFAASSTVIAVFENIVSFWIDLTGAKRWVISVINMALMCILCIPCILSNNILSEFTIFGLNIMNLEDTIVSKILLPVGCLVFCLFCTSKIGWGEDKYLEEVNTGNGLKLPKWIKVYLKYILPILLVALIVLSFIE